MSPEESEAERLGAEAEEAYEGGDNALSLELAEKAIAAGSEDEDVFFRRLTNLAALERAPEFGDASDEYIDRFPDQSDGLWSEMYALKALLFAKQGIRLEEGLRDADLAVTKDRTNSHAWHALAAVRYAEEKYEEAVEAAREAVAQDETTPVDFYMLYRAAMANEEAEVGEEALIDGLREYPDSVLLMVRLGWLSIENKEYDRARQQFEKALAEDDKSSEALSGLGFLYELLEEPDRAAEVFRRLTVVADVKASWLALGHAYRMSGDAERALQALQRADELPTEVGAEDDGEDWAKAKGELAACLIDLKEYSAALNLAEELRRREPLDNIAWYLKGKSELKLEFLREAIASSRKALAYGAFADPYDWALLARCYRATDQHENAWRAFMEAVRLDPTSPDLAFERAIESIEGGEYRRALNEFEKVDGRGGHRALVEYNRGVAYSRLACIGEACASWRRALEIDPDLTEAEEALLEAGCYGGSGREGWLDHWLGGLSASQRQLAGGVLVLLLVAALVLPLVLESSPSVISFIPAFVVLLLLVLPTVGKVSVGATGVTVDNLLPESLQTGTRLQDIRAQLSRSSEWPRTAAGPSMD